MATSGTTIVPEDGATYHAGPPRPPKSPAPRHLRVSSTPKSTRSLGSASGGHSVRNASTGVRAGGPGTDRIREVEALQARELVLHALTKSRDGPKVWKKLARTRYELWQMTLGSRALPAVREAYEQALQFTANNQHPDMWYETARVYTSFGAHEGSFQVSCAACVCLSG